MTLQARAFAWSQPDSTGDALLRTQDLEISPPFFPLAQGDVQILRLIFPTGTASEGRYFRILLDQLPAPQPRRGVQMVLRISLPVFMAPGDPDAAARLSWSAAADGAIEAHNAGNDWDEITALSLTLPGSEQRTPRLEATSPYLLPGAARRWTAGTRLRPGSQIRLAGDHRTGKFDLALTVGT